MKYQYLFSTDIYSQINFVQRYYLSIFLYKVIPLKLML